MSASSRKLKSVLMRPYARIVIPDDESGTFTATILEFPGCVTQGATAEEAYANLEKAAAAWIDAALDLGQEIPDPIEANQYSGRFALRMPRGLHKSAAEHAEREGSSLNQFIVAAVAERVGAHRLYSELTRKIEVRMIASTLWTIKAVSHAPAENTAATPPSAATEFRVSYSPSIQVN
jgi:predicted RNase H-like HicB family nuclease